MGAIYGGDTPSGGSRQPVAGQAIRSTKPSSWRQVLSVGDDRVRMCGFKRTLFQQDDEGGEAVQEGDRTTFIGMDGVEECNSTNQQEACGVGQRSIVHLPAGSPESRRGAQLYRVSPLPLQRTVSVSQCVTCYPFLDWPPGVYDVSSRKSNALYRRRFKIRIRMTEEQIGHVFSVEPREKMFDLINKMALS